MSKAFEEIAEPEVSIVWDEEIIARIQAVDEGRAEGVSFEDVMREAEGLLNSLRSDLSASLP